MRALSGVLSGESGPRCIRRAAGGFGLPARPCSAQLRSPQRRATPVTRESSRGRADRASASAAPKTPLQAGAFVTIQVSTLTSERALQRSEVGSPRYRPLGKVVSPFHLRAFSFEA